MVSDGKCQMENSLPLVWSLKKTSLFLMYFFETHGVPLEKLRNRFFPVLKDTLYIINFHLYS